LVEFAVEPVLATPIALYAFLSVIEQHTDEVVVPLELDAGFVQPFVMLSALV